MQMQKSHKRQLVWTKILFFLYFHIGAVYGYYLLFTTAKWKTIIWLCLLLKMSVLGVTVGVHRLWAHRSYKAKLPLRILLAFCQTLTFQLSIYNWVRDHRIHHKYSDTELDPHNASRGFFYSHMGWLLVKKSPEIVKKGEELDLSDLEADPGVTFQRKYYWYLAPIVAFAFPALVPWYFWSEPFWTSWYSCNMVRYFLSLHVSCLVNSAAHIWGNKPYDRHILPSENQFISFASFGEGFHNYHHAFPWDYKAAELGTYSLNTNTAFIDMMAKIGWAYDLKFATLEMVAKRVKRTGDGSWNSGEHFHGNIWGWDDKDMKKEDMEMAKILYRDVTKK